MNIINGSATGTNGSKINTWIEWEDINQDITANTSQLHMILYAQANTSVSTHYSATYNYGYLSYNGANIQYTSLSGYDFRNKAKIKFAEHTYTIAHNDDGTKYVTVKGYWTLNGQSDWIKDGTVSGTVTLNTIPRASSFICPSTFTLGASGTVKITSASDSFTHKIILTFGNQSYTYSNVVTSNKTVETGVTFSTNWGSEIPAASTGLGSVTVETYSGGTRIGTSTKQVTVNIPSNWTASATGLSITEANTSVVPTSWGVFVKGKSKLLVSLTGLAASSGSTISSYSYSAAGYTGTSSSLTTGVINQTSISVSGKATDRRGKSVTKTASVRVADYSNPSVNNVSVYRCTSGGNASSEGTYCYIKATGTKSILGSPDKNTGTLRYRSRVTGGTWSGYTVLTSNSAVIKSGFSADNSYEIEIEQTDYFTSAKVTKTISRAPSAERYINFNSAGSGVGIGGQSQTAGKLEVYYPTDFEGSTLPTINALPFVAEAKGFALYGGTVIPNNSDLNDDTFMDAGTWYCQNNSDANTLTNCPTGYAFRMIVLKTLKHLRVEGNGTNWIGSQQVIYDYMGNVYSRYIYYADTDTDKRIGVWYGGLKDNTTVGNLGWTGYRANGVNIPTLNTLAYWNGAYSGTSSNLEYFGSNALNNLTNHGTFSGSNANDCLTLGVWLINPSTTTTNLPYSDWGFLRVERQSNNYIQTFFRLYGQNTFVRIYANGEWRGWRELGNGVDGGTYNYVTATGSNVTLTGSTANDLCTLTVPHRDVWLVEGYCKVTATASANTKVELYLNNYWSNHRVGAWIPYTNTPLYMQYNHVAWGTDISSAIHLALWHSADVSVSDILLRFYKIQSTALT